MSKILKVVITGGPCAGKTSALEKIKNYYENKNIKVFVINETATELINQGITPWNQDGSLKFQTTRLKLQLQKENEIDEKINTLKNENVLVIYDRGLLDTLAYVSKKEFNELLKQFNLNIIDARDKYDAVFHLLTTAKDKQEFYTLENNKARIETIEEASILDDKVISAWCGHPHFRIINSYDTFNEKVNTLINEIDSLLDTSNTLEIERKYLIKYPNINFLNNYAFCEKVEISQSYLTLPNNEKIRIRKRGLNNNYIYFKTIKKNINNIKRIEIENRLTEQEYLSYLNESIETYTITKDRYCIMYKNQYFELDVYPFWDNQAVIEIELNDENQKIIFPDFIDFIKEITLDKDYTNHSLAKKYNL